MTQFLEAVILIAAAGLILTAAWQDFTTWKIRNWTVLALIGLHAVLALVRVAGASDPPAAIQGFYGDLAAGLLLFVLGFLLWACRMLGAGDAKLFFPIGLFVGMNYLFAFGVGLAAGAILVAMALRFPTPPLFQGWAVMDRIEEIRATGKVPYGIIMAGAALAAMFSRYGAA